MSKYVSEPARPRAGDGTPIGPKRYRLLRAAFRHAQDAVLAGQYLETITVQESLLTDRLASLVHGSLGQPVTLRNTLGDLIRLAEANVVVPRQATEAAAERSRRRELPEDVVVFVSKTLRQWWKQRNHAVHAMAKVRHSEDPTFSESYAALREPALVGFILLLQLDALDQRERAANGARRASSWPNAFATSSELEPLLFKIRRAAR